MKILQVVHSFLPYTVAGTEVYTYRLSKELMKRHEVAIFFRINDRRKKEYALVESSADGMQLYAINHTFRHSSSFKDTYDDRGVDKVFGCLLDKIKPDIIHIQHLLFLSLGIIDEANNRGIPVVFTVNDYWLFCHKGQLLNNNLKVCDKIDLSGCIDCLKPQLCIRKNSLALYDILRKRAPKIILQFFKESYIRFMEQFVLKKQQLNDLMSARAERVTKRIPNIDRFIAPSFFIRSKFIELGIPENKIIFCQYGIDKTQLTPNDSLVSFPVKFGYIGTLLPMKGIDLLISAFRNVRGDNLVLSVYGRVVAYAGYEDFDKKIKRSVSCDRRIRLMGEIKNNDIAYAMRQMDVLVVPSIWPENSPLVIQEAFAMHKPVLASRTGGIKELVRDGVDGLLFKPGDGKDLEEKIRCLAANPDLIKNFKFNIPYIKSIEDNAREMESIYKELIGRKL